MRGFYWDLPPVGILLVGLLAALVAVKGLSMVWTISETETIKETLRSSMYLAAFLMALAALTSGRQVGPLMDISVLMVAAVAGYGLLQKIKPDRVPRQLPRRGEGGLDPGLREHHRRHPGDGGGAGAGPDEHAAQPRPEGALRGPHALLLSSRSTSRSPAAVSARWA